VHLLGSAVIPPPPLVPLGPIAFSITLGRRGLVVEHLALILSPAQPRAPPLHT
jgi:hypothetical protein